MPSVPTLPDIQRSLEAAATCLKAAGDHSNDLPRQANIIAAGQAYATLARAQLLYLQRSSVM